MACVLLSLFAVDLVSPARSDEVHYRDRQGKPQAASGEITEYNGQQLELRTSGREKTIPASLVDHVETEWPAAQEKAEELVANGQFSAAIEQYRLALVQEKRRWGQRKILSDIAWCYRNAGNFEAACVAFLKLVGDDADTQYFAAIPLSWQPNEPSVRFRQRAKQWLGSENTAVESLLGASWLLSTSDRANAIESLQRLARQRDERIKQLARTQLWRTQVVLVDEDRVQQWQTEIDRMPTALRAGPYFLLGRAHARLGHRDQSALALLRIPILDDRDRRLTQACLLAAARVLDVEPSRDEAIQLYQQAIEVNESSSDGQQAKNRLKELGKE